MLTQLINLQTSYHIFAVDAALYLCSTLCTCGDSSKLTAPPVKEVIQSPS